MTTARFTSGHVGGKANVLGVLVDATDYNRTVDDILRAAGEGRPLGVSALAVHGVMTGVADRAHRFRLNSLDLVVPDGQPVRWALNHLYDAGLEDRVAGPALMLRLCEAAAQAGLPVFFYGSGQQTLDRLRQRLEGRFPSLVIAGAEPSKFRRTTSDEKLQIVDRIRESGAKLTFVGLGCPRQEVFAFEYREALGMPVIAVGAAFAYHAGELRQPSTWVERNGLEWLHRLVRDPRRLWKRYVVGNPLYLLLLAAQSVGLWRPRTDDARPPTTELRYG
jgi:exopolysaccharide biosynthesis WecB/TagA/CpsF family protein